MNRRELRKQETGHFFCFTRRIVVPSRVPGPGLLESVYEYFLARELQNGGAQVLSYLRLAKLSVES